MISENQKSSVTAVFATSKTGRSDTTSSGTLLVGCDGTRSKVRASLFGGLEQEKNRVLPVRLLGVSVVYPSALAQKMRQLDPFFLQAGDPLTNTFFWFSFLDAPGAHDRSDRESSECQILVSWPFRAGFRGQKEPLEVPATNGERIQLMKKLADGWAEPFREIVQAIPEDTTEAKTISLEDWEPVPSTSAIWNSLATQRVALVGDAAHAMTMCMSRPILSCPSCFFFFSFFYRHSTIQYFLHSRNHQLQAISYTCDTFP